jgi:hypothetical protein
MRALIGARFDGLAWFGGTWAVEFDDIVDEPSSGVKSIDL